MITNTQQTTPPIYKAAENLAAMQAEAMRRLWENGHFRPVEQVKS
ncbi:hypothetical protein [Paraburkholderia haematera]|uniref:Uncharacterized protein n=1 Tax=Paraburkholderia haematera TaxID=2793077 RepID=A0ABN7KUJ8_9BURK|nr:hypothetical protein [Paraburkholderia haematera]CAE6714156.1 hypothetical protein R69888_01291 [Paraburkholderia haematera]